MGNIMKVFDGKVELNGDGINFRFSSLASLNLFLFNVGVTEKYALGLFRDSLHDKKHMTFAPSHRSCDRGHQRERTQGQKVFKLFIKHSNSKDWRYLDLVAQACNFELIELGSATNRRKVLFFNTKKSLFEFWTGFTGRVLSKVYILDLNLKEEPEYRDSIQMKKKPESRNIADIPSNVNVQEGYSINFDENNVDVTEAVDVVSKKVLDDFEVNQSVLPVKSLDDEAIIKNNVAPSKDEVERDEKIVSGAMIVKRVEGDTD